MIWCKTWSTLIQAFGLSFAKRQAGNCSEPMLTYLQLESQHAQEQSSVKF